MLRLEFTINTHRSHRHVIRHKWHVVPTNVITTDASDWATNCPEYKVTAVQVVAVSQPSEWQQNYQRFNKNQLDLLAKAQSDSFEVVGK
jgi:predicted molibdopterin-dependent oxidoreductase YjgC